MTRKLLGFFFKIPRIDTEFLFRRFAFASAIRDSLGTGKAAHHLTPVMETTVTPTPTVCQTPSTGKIYLYYHKLSFSRFILLPSSDQASFFSFSKLCLRKNRAKRSDYVIMQETWVNWWFCTELQVNLLIKREDHKPNIKLNNEIDLLYLLYSLPRYECRCKLGFVGDGKSCKKEDPCEQCHSNAVCDSYTQVCKCKNGFIGDGWDNYS